MHQILAWLKYYFSAKTVYNVHSPFVYDFILNCLDTSKDYYVFPHLEHERKILLNNKSFIPFEDLGAGEKSGNRRIAEIARSSLSSQKQCRLLFNIIRHYKPTTSLELGTSLGLSTLYMSHASDANTLYTLEGNLSSAKMANILFQQNHRNNIKLVVGRFDETLPELLKTLPSIDLVFLDGHHSEEATIRYFQTLLPKLNNRSVFILDDIYWSPGMARAWRTVLKNKDRTLAIDLFDIGILFFDPKLSRDEISLIDFWKKPWKLGIFG